MGSLERLWVNVKDVDRFLSILSHFMMFLFWILELIPTPLYPAAV